MRWASHLVEVVASGVVLATEIIGSDDSETRNGTPDNDTIDAQDGGFDIINGGFGSNTCFFDSSLDLVPSCP